MSHRNDGENPSPPQRYALRVLRLEAGQAVEVAMVSEAIDGLYVHWIKGRGGVYCPPDEDCKHCDHKEPITWRGYVLAELWNEPTHQWFPTVLELTESAEIDLRGRYKRGTVWELAKPKVDKPRKAPLTVRYLYSFPPSHPLPSFDFLPALALMYHRADIRLGRKNPMPGRLFAAPHEGAALAEAANADHEDPMEVRRTLDRLLGERGHKNGKVGGK